MTRPTALAHAARLRCGDDSPAADGSSADRGSGAAAVIIFAFLFLALAAFVVDGGLSISQRERAADIAEQAARYAAEDIDVNAYRANGVPVINAADCDARVRDFARKSGMDAVDVGASYCTATAPTRVDVEIQLTYHPTLTGFFYDKDITVHGTASAESVAGGGAR